MSEPARPLAAVIVTYNSADVIADCLRSVEVAFSAIGRARLIVVDNDSHDATLEVVREVAPHAEIVARTNNGGFAVGVNVGMTAAEGCDVLVLNPDIRLDAGAVVALRRTLEEPGAGIAVPALRGPDGRHHPSLRRRPTALRALGEALMGGYRAGRLSALGEHVLDPEAYRRAGAVDWATGAAWLVSRRCIDAIGTLDERYFLYSEETEYMLRAGDAGFDVRYEPAARAVHLGGDQLTSPALWALGATNKVRMQRERAGRASAASMWAAVVLNELIRALLRGRAGGARHRTALRHLVAMRRWPQPIGRSGEDHPPYVCFAAQDWWYHNRAHSDFQLMRALAVDRKVLVINSIGMRMPTSAISTHPLRRILRKLRSVAKLVRRPLPDLPNFHVMSPLPLPFYGSAFTRGAGALLVRTQVLAVCALLRIRRPVIVVTIPTAWEAVRSMPRRALVFNRSDRHSDFPEADRDTIARLEQELLRNADTVFYVSHALMAEERAFTGERAKFLDHGVDLDHFRRSPVPEDLESIPEPRVGFFGALDDFVVDFDLLERLAADLPEVSLVLIGDATYDMTRFEKYPNVYWLGFRSYEKIPSYGSGFSVGIMPWLDNDWIHRSNPVKLKEYLALGLPVVSTPYAELDRYADRVRTAGDHAAFVEAVRESLRNGPPCRPERLRDSVRSFSWRSLSERLVRVVESADQPARDRR